MILDHVVHKVLQAQRGHKAQLDLKEIKVQLALKVLQERLAKELNPQL